VTSDCPIRLAKCIAKHWWQIWAAIPG